MKHISTKLIINFFASMSYLVLINIDILNYSDGLTQLSLLVLVLWIIIQLFVLSDSLPAYFLSFILLGLSTLAYFIHKPFAAEKMSEYLLFILIVALLYDVFKSVDLASNKRTIRSYQNAFITIQHQIEESRIVRQILHLKLVFLRLAIFGICLYAINIVWHQNMLLEAFFMEHSIIYLVQNFGLIYTGILISTGIIVLVLTKKLLMNNKVVQLITIIICMLFITRVQKVIFDYKLSHLVKQIMIFRIEPDSGHVWDQIHILGNNFGEAQTENSKVIINGNEHRILSWSNKEIVFVVDPIKSATGKLYIINSDNQQSNSTQFTYINI